MPLRPRCGYAAVFPRSLPGGSCPPPRKFPARHERAGARRRQPRSTRFRAGAASRGCHTPVPRVLLSVTLAGPAPSGSPDTSRLCRGCSRPHRRFPDQAAPSFAALLRQGQRWKVFHLHSNRQRLTAHVDRGLAYAAALPTIDRQSGDTSSVAAKSLAFLQNGGCSERILTTASVTLE